MSKSETKSGVREDLPEEHVARALSGLVGDLKSFQAGIETKLKQTEERVNMLDRKTMIAGRPALARTADTEAPHQKAFEAYVRSGDDDGLRGLELDGKSLNTAVSGEGGYLVDPVTSATVQTVLKSTASIRAVANVVNVEATFI